MVFNYLEHNMLTYIQNFGTLNPLQLKNVAFRLLQGLYHIHTHQFIHRDIKPENILITPNSRTATLCDCAVCVADFGIAKKLKVSEANSDYVSTRWYRAPEQLLGMNYGEKADIFALGCCLAEFYTGNPLFPGTGQVDQLVKIMEILGSPQSQKPSSKSFKEFIERLSIVKNQNFAQFSIEQASSNIKIITGCPEQLADLIAQMLNWDPEKRFNALQCLSHPFFII